jgi:O-succinylbenzoic acid--CoA ligase
MIHASAELGVTLYPLDPRLPSQWRQGLLKNGGVDSLLVCDSNPSTDLDVSDLSITALKIGGEVKKIGAGVPIVIATSGSGGEPKGIMLEWDSIYHSAMAVNHRLGLRATDCWLNCLPLYHIGGLSIIFRTVLAGASMVLHQGFDAMHVWQDIRRYQVTHISLVPVMLAKLLEVADDAPPEHLRVVLVGGAALDESLARRALDVGWPLFVTYGMSETASQVATQPLNSAVAIRDPIPLLAGTECSVVDAKGVLTNGPGQIRLRGEFLMRGYANPGHKAGDGLDDDGWYVTGDIGTCSVESGIQITGRADEIIISGGENIHPQQVEQLLRDCPGISDLCVFGIDDPEWGERVCVTFSGDASEQAVAQWCRERIAGVLRPRQFVRLEALPRLSNGKIDRHTLKQLRI